MEESRIIVIRPTPDNPLEDRNAFAPSRIFLHYILTQALNAAPCEMRSAYAQAPDTEAEASQRPAIIDSSRPLSASFELYPFQPDAVAYPQAIASVPVRWYRSFIVAFHVAFSLGLYGGFDRTRLLSYQGHYYPSTAFSGHDATTGHWLRIRISSPVDATTAGQLPTP